MSSSLRFLTTGFINAVQLPMRMPFRMSSSCRAI